jgi:hypothetical protein
MASAQDGEEITPTQFYNEYLKSPNYINRLKLQGYKDPKKTINDRLNNLNKTKVTNVKGIGNVYNPGQNTINLDSEEQKKYNLNPLSTKVHEYSHAAGSLGNYLTFPEEVKNTTLNRKEINLIDRGNRFWNLDLDDRKKYSIDKAMEIDHDRRASEVKADMDVLRYNLKKDKMYDTGTQNFNQEYLNKSKNKYKNNKVINRLFDRYNDKDLINLMNTVAKTDDDNLSFAQNGHEMSFYQNGLDWTPRNISKNGSQIPQAEDGEEVTLDDLLKVVNKRAASDNTKAVPRQSDKRTMAEALDQKARANQPVIKQSSGPQLTKEQIFAKNKQYAEAQGKTFNPNTGAVTPFLSPSTARTFERGSENIVEPIIEMSPIGELGMIDDVYKLAKPIASSIGKNTINRLGYSAARKILKVSDVLPEGIIRDNLNGLGRGIIDIQQGRPFFETFPITKKQRVSVEAAQDKAFNEGIQFVKDWNYPEGGLQIRPEVEQRIKNIFPKLNSSPTNLNSFLKDNPITSANNLLVNSKTIPLLMNRNVSNSAKNFISNNRGRIGGVNMNNSKESITLRNHGLYYVEPEQIKDIAAHELGHSMQKLGNLSKFQPGYDFYNWGDRLAINHPDYKYQIANQDVPFGKEMGDAMVKPEKGKYTWEASPLEPHSELMTARMKAYDFYKNQLGSEQTLQALQNPNDDMIDWFMDVQDLHRFFEPTTTEEVKRKIIRGLPATIPAIGLGAAAATQQKKQGGEITKDDNGYWNPENWGKPVEIGSNNITMKGLQEMGYDNPLLGISDTGDVQMMYPGEDYKFKGSKVIEYPVKKNGGWLDRYN